MFDPPLVGPYEFKGYKHDDKNAAWLMDNDGNMFDCTAAHLVPLFDAPLVKKRRRDEAR